MKNNLTGGRPPKEMTILETHKNNLKEFDEKFSYDTNADLDGWSVLMDKADLLPMGKQQIYDVLTSSTKAILEAVKGEIEKREAHWAKLHEENMPNNTLIGYHADSCLRALSDISAIINKAIEEIK